MTPTEFEGAVATLLRMSGYEVRRETQLGHKKVDLYAEGRNWGRPRRIAVECKLYDRQLTQQLVNEIYSNYRPLYDANLIDEVLLVTSTGIAPSAEAMVTLARGLSHVTFSELQNTVIDFSGYLVALSRQVNDDGLASYYVRPELADGRDLEDRVLAWLEDSDRPLAILGSYGMGKTSFARHLAAQLADIALADTGARIPIFIRLAEISAEQSLEGLLGRIFTTTNEVRNYRFDAFMELNRRGRFVIFLDAFDEMKHTLVWDQFRYNFKEINRLVVPMSRVILLGRPTAFLSDAEHQYILHGVRRGSGTILHDPEWPDYEEIHLQPFTRPQAQQFLHEYTTYLVRSGKAKTANAEEVRSRIAMLPPEKLADLASRPVQLRILSEVLPQWDGDITTLTAASLYSTFINIVIEREQEKITRRRFELRERRDFARDLAYWLWTAKSAMSIDATAIPAELLPTPKGDDTLEGVRRDLVSACFLDRKLGESLYFPHRSFQEFLVAEKIVHEIRLVNIDAQRLSAAVTPEVGEFLSALAEPDDFERFFGSLRRRDGSMRLPILQAWMRRQDIAEHVVTAFKHGDGNPWTTVMVAVAASLPNRAVISPEDALSLLARVGKRWRALSLLSGIMIAEAETRSNAVVTDGLLNLLRLAYEAAFSEMARRLGTPAHDRPGRFEVYSCLESNMARQIPITGTYPEMRYDLRRAALLLVNEIGGDGPMVSDWAEYVRTAHGAAERRLQYAVIANSNVLQETDFSPGRGALTFASVMTNRLSRIARARESES